MINLKTINVKKFFTKSNKTKVLDLTQSSLKYNHQVSIERAIYVTEEFVMRPDLISEIVYGDTNKLDFILKYNEISNPFSIFEGQYLFIPNREEMNRQFKNNTDTDTNDNDTGHTTQPADNRYQSDKNREEYLNKIKDGRLDRNKPIETVSPNLVEDGQHNIVFKDNKIIFGSNVTTVAIDNCPELSTKTRIKEALLSKRPNLSKVVISDNKKISSFTNVNQDNQTT